MVNLKKNFQDVLEFVNNKKCIVRCDLNMPVVDGKFLDFTRLDKIIPTLEKLLLRNSKIILISHIGRPDGKISEELSLKCLVPHIEKRINRNVFFCSDDILSSQAENKIKKLLPKDILLMENIRFYKEEIENNFEFSKKISEYADIFINESFSSSHRNHASITGIASFLPSFPGELFEYELRNLNVITKNFQKSSSIAVLGGAKISTKIGIIENLTNMFDKVLIGGAMANTFLASQGIKIGKSFNEPKMQQKALGIYKKFKGKIILPEDVIVSDSLDSDNNMSVDVENIKETEIIYDIGPKTRKRFYNEIVKSKKLLWNGPLGFFERKPYDNGTNYVSSVVKSQNSKNFFSVAGGGDTISALKNSKNINYFSFISTGGGAFLEFIEGKNLPGVEILNK